MMFHSRRKKTLWVVLCGCTIIFISAIYLAFYDCNQKDNLLEGYNTSDVSCYDEESTTESLESFDATDLDEKSIFFLETSCFRKGEVIIKSRQACAVESAAKMNPGMTVYFLFLSPSPLSNNSKIIYERLRIYKNIKIQRLQVKDFLSNTPLEDWYATVNLTDVYWANSQMSDVLRYTALWKYGGIYLDLDVVIMKSLENMTNFVGAESSNNVASGVMGFSSSGFGRQVADECMNQLRTKFQEGKHQWGYNGPGVITRTLKKLCHVHEVTEMTDKCKEFEVMPPKIFYPIFFWEWKKYFETEDLSSKIDSIADSYAIHVWNKLSYHQNIRIGEKNLYSIVADKFCPDSYHNSGEWF